MASYTLFLGPPGTKGGDAALGVESEDVIALGVSPDPYVAREIWSGESLASLRATLEWKVAQWRAEAVAAVLAETRRPRAEPWMEAMIAARGAADRRIGHAEALLALVTRALAEGGTVVFFGD
jgi:hypothetical protein